MRGEVEISGAKNAALPAIFASLLTSEPLVLSRIPRLRDVETAIQLVQALGKRVSWKGEEVSIREEAPPPPVAPEGPVRSMRASFLVLGPLVARLGRARVPHPGGCAIGPRPVDLHLRGLARLGADLSARRGWVEARASRLRGTAVYLDFPSVGATEQLLLAGALAEGETLIINPAREPEVVDLTHLLSAMGAQVRWGVDRVSITGAGSLGGASWEVIPDRIEAGTYLLAGAITGGRVRTVGTVPGHLEALLIKLEESGVEVGSGKDWVEVFAPRRPKGIHVETGPYPGFPTDLQPPMVSFLALSRGESTVRERVFENRFGHVGELLRMGAVMHQTGALLSIEGVDQLSGAKVRAPDIRAGAALVLAGLAAQGTTEIEGVEHLERGYERLEEKLAALGAEVWRQ